MPIKCKCDPSIWIVIVYLTNNLQRPATTSKMRNITSFLIFLLKLGFISASLEFAGRNRSLNIDFKNLTGLTCFQCKSSLQDTYPACDSIYFTGTNKRMKTDLLMQCREEMSFCVKKVLTKSKTARITERGCGTSHDLNMKVVRTGCMFSNDIEICVCQKNLCNHTNKLCRLHHSNWPVLLVFVYNILIYINT